MSTLAKGSANFYFWGKVLSGSLSWLSRMRGRGRLPMLGTYESEETLAAGLICVWVVGSYYSGSLSCWMGRKILGSSIAAGLFACLARKEVGLLGAIEGGFESRCEAASLD